MLFFLPLLAVTTLLQTTIPGVRVPETFFPTAVTTHGTDVSSMVLEYCPLSTTVVVELELALQLTSSTDLLIYSAPLGQKAWQLFPAARAVTRTLVTRISRLAYTLGHKFSPRQGSTRHVQVPPNGTLDWQTDKHGQITLALAAAGHIGLFPPNALVFSAPAPPFTFTALPIVLSLPAPKVVLSLPAPRPILRLSAPKLLLTLPPVKVTPTLHITQPTPTITLVEPALPSPGPRPTYPATARAATQLATRKWYNMALVGCLVTLVGCLIVLALSFHLAVNHFFDFVVLYSAGASYRLDDDYSVGHDSPKYVLDLFDQMTTGALDVTRTGCPKAAPQSTPTSLWSMETSGNVAGMDIQEGATILGDAQVTTKQAEETTMDSPIISSQDPVDMSSGSSAPDQLEESAPAVINSVDGLVELETRTEISAASNELLEADLEAKEAPVEEIETAVSPQGGQNQVDITVDSTDSANRSSGSTAPDQPEESAPVVVNSVDGLAELETRTEISAASNELLETDLEAKEAPVEVIETAVSPQGGQNQVDITAESTDSANHSSASLWDVHGRIDGASWSDEPCEPSGLATAANASGQEPKSDQPSVEHEHEHTAPRLQVVNSSTWDSRWAVSTGSRGGSGPSRGPRGGQVGGSRNPGRGGGRGETQAQGRNGGNGGHSGHSRRGEHGGQRGSGDNRREAGNWRSGGGSRGYRSEGRSDGSSRNGGSYRDNGSDDAGQYGRSGSMARGVRKDNSNGSRTETKAAYFFRLRQEEKAATQGNDKEQ